MSEPSGSIRSQVAQNLVDTCVFGSLNDSYGVMLTKDTDKKNKSFWGITFCKARILDGYIRVYSEKYILITWETAIRDLPRKGSQVCRNEYEAKDFLVKTFIERFV